MSGVASPLSAAERVRRNREIAEARARGDGWREVAERFGISERHARRAELEHLREAGSRLEDVEPDAVLRETLAAYDWASRTLADLAEEADNTSAAVAAVRTRVDVAERRVLLLAKAGRVPATTEGWRIDLEMREVVRAIVAIAERRGIALDELMTELEPLPGAGRPVRELRGPER